jgi:hypothetical protein
MSEMFQTGHFDRGDDQNVRFGSELLPFLLDLEYLGSSPACPASVILRTCEVGDPEAKAVR